MFCDDSGGSVVKVETILSLSSDEHDSLNTFQGVIQSKTSHIVEQHGLCSH